MTPSRGPIRSVASLALPAVPGPIVAAQDDRTLGGHGMPRRGRGKRAGLLHHSAVLAAAGLIAHYALVPRYGFGVVLLFVFVVLPLWLLFAMPTACDFEVRGRGCVRGVRGKARGCFQHDRLKRDAIFAALGMRNPGMAFRVMWLDSTSGGRALGGSPGAGSGTPGPTGDTANRAQARYNTISIIVAAVGSVAGVLALILQ